MEKSGEIGNLAALGEYAPDILKRKWRRIRKIWRGRMLMLRKRVIV
jgi:hypothetical protein